MPALAGHVPSPVASVTDLHKIKDLKSDRSGRICTRSRSRSATTRSCSRKRSLTSEPNDASAQEVHTSSPPSPANRNAPRRCISALPDRPQNSATGSRPAAQISTGGNNEEELAAALRLSHSSNGGAHDDRSNSRYKRRKMMEIPEEGETEEPEQAKEEAVVEHAKPVGDEAILEKSEEIVQTLWESPGDHPKWDPRDGEQMSAAKEAIHVSTEPSTVACREDEQKRIFEFCKSCVEQEKAGSLYACGCPGTGKSLCMGKVNQRLIEWAREAGFHSPDVLSINCTALAKTSEVFAKILEKAYGQKKSNGSVSPLHQLQNLYAVNQQSHGKKMMLIIVDELDYLITKDRAVLHELFMLTTLPFSKCILIGIANAIDLADRFLPRLKSLNCKPMVVTFRAYSHKEILKILQQRLMVLSYAVFQTRALELCARKVAAASGDMRRALSVCRSAIEILEMELRESTANASLTPAEEESFNRQTVPAPKFAKKQEVDIVRVDHMVLALSKAYRSSTVDTIQLLPQHQQIVLCSTAKLFRGKKKDATVGEINKCYIDICKTSLVPPVGFLEFSSMCRVLADQGLLKISQCREEKAKRVTLKVDEADIIFALQGVRFFRNCLQ